MNSFTLSRIIAGKILYKNSRRKHRPEVRLSIISVALGLAVMIVAIAITGGYKNMIRDKIVGVGAHIRISNYDQNYSFEQQPFSREQIFIKDLQANPNIVHLQYYATKAGVVKTDNQVEGIVLKGIDTTFNRTAFLPNVVDGTTIDVSGDQASDQILISSKMAKKLLLKTGDKLRVYFIQEPPMQRSFTIKGMYETGIPEYDNQLALVDLRHVQKLNRWDSTQTGAIELFIDNYDKIDQMGAWVSDMIGYKLKSETIKQIYPAIFEWIALFDTNVIVLIIIIIIVSVITVLSSFFIITVEQTQKIGLFKALGMPEPQIITVFFIVASRILLTGMIVGNSIALIICFLQKYGKLVTLNPDTYYVDFIPIQINIPLFLAINAALFIICMAVVAIPALFISKKISPVTALRYE